MVVKAVNLHGLDLRVELSRGKCQPEADEGTLHQVIPHRLRRGKEDGMDDDIAAYHADDDRP
jgi:hypothetical protein